MTILTQAFFWLVATVQVAVALPTAQSSSDATIPGKYIITLRDGLSDEAFEAHTTWAQDVHKRSIARRDSDEALNGIEQVYQGFFSGYAGGFDEETIREIEASDDVVAVEADQMWTLFDVQPNAPWGLASISNRGPGFTDYRYNSCGQRTFGYVVDTGINLGHVEFGGRAVWGYNAVNGINDDENGHGTHVSGTMAGSTYGVAKCATAVAVKVFAGSGGTVSTVLNGFNWAVNDIISRGRLGFAVINMSLGGGFSAAFNQAIEDAYRQEIFTIVAAGNENQNANNVSPASAISAFTVGAHDINWRRSSFSNWGERIDAFAPGSGITSAWIGSSTALRVLDGTSMASPHAAGVALTIISTAGFDVAASYLQLQMAGRATRDRLQDPRDSRNSVVNNGFDME